MSKPLWEIARLPPEEALAYWRERVPLTKDEWSRLEQGHQERAFTVAGVTNIQFLSAIYDGIEKALAEGITLQEFHDQVGQVAAATGFQGMAPWHLQVVFYNNLNSAYMTGRYQQMRHPRTVAKRPIWMYDAVGDQRTRPSHMALDGVARRHDDPFWNEYYPPNGHYCRCDVVTLSPAEAKRMGVRVDEGTPAWAMEPDEGWNQNPAASWDNWEPDLSRLPTSLRAAYEARKRS